MTKVVVFGGAGQAGKVHVKNLLSLGAEVASFDVVENPEVFNFNAKEQKPEACVEKGFLVALVALPDFMLFPHTDKILDAGFSRVMVEKPGSMKSEDLEKLVAKAESKGITMYINYQRQFDPRVAQLTQKIKARVEEGYELDYVSVYSCDKAQPPQAAPQVLNQGCHDYALLFTVLEAAQAELKELQARGVNWKGTEDTKFFKITGTAEKSADSQALFDVQMGRVSSVGTFTDVYVKMSKFNEQQNMYEPFEEQLRFPEQPDPDAHWADVWKDAFVCSDEALMKGENGVPVAFGVKVLKFAEMAAQSHSQNGGVVAKA